MEMYRTFRDLVYILNTVRGTAPVDSTEKKKPRQYISWYTVELQAAKIIEITYKVYDC